MKEYIKPNVILPVSLHDTRISHIVIENDTISFVFDTHATHTRDFSRELVAEYIC